MRRYAMIYDRVLRIYRSMETVCFPIEPCRIIQNMDNCRAMTYQQFASINQCGVGDVIRFFQSRSGCTQYDAENDRYLILWNERESGRSVPGRHRWTKAHELGHVVLGHLPMRAGASYAPEYEAEADCFAAALLCPMPLFEELRIQSPEDIGYVFGLSAEASGYRWEEYLRWIKQRKRTAWENDICSVIRDRKRLGRLYAPSIRAVNADCFEWDHGAVSIWKDPNEPI